MDETTKADILRSISLTGVANDKEGNISVAVANTQQGIELFISRAGGLPGFKDYHAKQFTFILNQPLAIRIISPLAIRCCLCGEVIKYPAWHRLVRYAKNQFHYFVCFDGNSPSKVTAKCFRR